MLIEELEVEFGSGLNILTGETGAGKSIIIGALKMILGERASTEVVRTGARKAVVEGQFDDADSPKIRRILDEYQIEHQPRLILRREISTTQSRAFINDSPATAQALREIASQVIDLHGQHEHQSLLRVETHLELLDNFGGLGGLLRTYREHYETTEHLLHERQALASREQELRQKKELIEFQINEIDAVAPVEGEEEALDAERRVLENAEHLVEATERLYQMMYEAENSIYDQLVVSRNELRDLARIDAQFQVLFDEVKSAEIIISEATKFIQDYNARVEFNPERLEEIRERQGQLEFLKLKYGGTLEAVLAHRADIGRTYDLAADFEGAVARIDQDIRRVGVGLSEAAHRLSVKRREVARRIEQAIMAELVDLGIPHGTFDVHFEQERAPEGWIHRPDENGQPCRFSAFANGMDQGEFYISTNLGETSKPLARVASGGEVSRIMLALKTILAKSERLPILVFDEIDVGVSGPVAHRVGERMKNLAQYHQIIAITHLPQIAALGDIHFVVIKDVEAGRTKTRIRRLDEHQRTVEVATLLSGTEVTEAALESARELMAAGRNGE